MNHRLATIIIVFTLVIAAIFSVVIKQKKLEKLDITSNVKEVTQNSKLIDMNLDHNQALDVIDYAKRKNIKVPKILINFDTHSDIFVNADILKYKESDVSSWINNLLASNPQINTIYWVMPMEEAKNIDLMTIFGAYGGELPDEEAFILFGNISDKKTNEFTFLFKPLYKKAYKQEFYFDPKTGKMNAIPEKKENLKKLFNTDESNLRKIEVITCTENTLPNLKGQDVFLSIDADYISNSGFDTYNDFKFVKRNEHEINATFYSIFDTLKKKEIKPTIISLSLSPRYLPKQYQSFVDITFKYITLTANKFDMIDKYKNRYVEEYEEAGD